MAEAARVDRESKPDAARIINQLKDLSSRISKISSDSKIRNEFPEEIEKTLPQTLKDQQACLQKMLDDGSFSEDVDHSYQLACNLINEIENNSRDQKVTAIPKIKEGLKRIKDRLLAFHVKESRQALRIIKCLKDWCSCLYTWKSSQSKSETELENILQSLENPSASKRRVSESTYKISDMSEEVKEFLDWPEQKRWPETMSTLSGCIENEVKELKKRFEDALDIIKSTPIVDRLKGMKEAMDGILKYIRGLRFNTKVFVKTKPWNSEKRGTEFPSEEIQNDKKTVESSVFDLVITRPSSPDEECDRSVQASIGLESQKEEAYYTLTNSNGKIEISSSPTVPMRLATYTFHVRHKGRGGWAQYTSRLKDGETAVSIDTDPFAIDAVFVTSQLDTHTIAVTAEGCTINLDPENKDMKIVFPPNCVRSTMKVAVQVTTIDVPIKKQKIQQILENDHGILGISDLVNVSHEHPFLVPVRLTLPIPPLQPTPEGEQPTVYVLHVEGDEVQELKSAIIKEVDKDVFEVTTDCFSSPVCVRSRPSVPAATAIFAVEQIYIPVDDLRCNILLFSKREPDGKFRLRSEIVSQNKRKEKVTERVNDMGMDPLSDCQSPTIKLKNMERVRVSLGNKTAVVFHTKPVTQCIIYDRKNQDNSLTYLVRKNAEFGSYGYASLEYNLDSGNRKSLHKADFYVDFCTRKDKAADYSAVFSEKSMTRLARQIPGERYTSLAVWLGINSAEADNLARMYGESEKMLRLLLQWLQQASTDPTQRLNTIVEALTEIGQNVLADGMKDAFNNKEYFKL